MGGEFSNIASDKNFAKTIFSPDLKGRNNLEHIRFFLLFIMTIIPGPCGQISSQFYYIIIRR